MKKKEEKVTKASNKKNIFSKTKKSSTNIFESTNSQKNDGSKKLYFGYESRLVINVVVFGLFLTLCLLFATRTIEREKSTPINYTDVNDITYKVYLNKNDIYNDEYLGMNRAYVASLIKYIDIDFNYLFNIEAITDMDFDYKIIANLIIKNQNGTNYVDEEYIIKDSTNEHLTDGGNMLIKENIIIDYGYYNNLANKFKNQTGVETNSYLNVYMLVNKKTSEKLNYKINESNKLNIKIPLSERAIEINLDSNNQTVTKQVIPVGNIKFNIVYLILEIVFYIITCMFLIKIIRYVSPLIKEKTAYDKYVMKLLKEYDRLIVETKTVVKMDDCRIVDVKNFSELLDVRDNLKQPIIYLNIVEHEKGMFYIKNNSDVYRLILKGIDLEKKKYR